ncbi:MAG: hypothetical protein C4B59_15720, partial [Candidatus Methanogaster sp.]
MKKRDGAFGLTGFVLIAGLLAMVVLVGTAAADQDAYIRATSKSEGDVGQQNFIISMTLNASGFLGDCSDPDPPECPDGYGGRIYVVNHQKKWVNGTNLTDVSSDGYETVGWMSSYGVGGRFFETTWPTPLKPGIYDLILDLNVTGCPYVWTNTTKSGEHIEDPMWVVYVNAIELNMTAFISGSGSCPGSDPLNVNIGDTVTYCFNVTNTGGATLTNITLNDSHYGVIAINDTLAPGQSTNGNATHTVNESDILHGTNKANVSARDPANNLVEDTDNCTIIVDYNASISKTPDYPRNAAIGESVNFTIFVDLPNATLHKVTVNDTLPAGFIYNSSSFNLTANNDSFNGIVSGPEDGTAPVHVNWTLGTVNNS